MRKGRNSLLVISLRVTYPSSRYQQKEKKRKEGGKKGKGQINGQGLAKGCLHPPHFTKKTFTVSKKREEKKEERKRGGRRK